MSSPSHTTPTVPFHTSNSDEDTGVASNSSCWNPHLRIQLTALSALGLVETNYLTYDKLRYAKRGEISSLFEALCSAAMHGVSLKKLR